MDTLKSVWMLCTGKEAAIHAGARVVQDLARLHEGSVRLFGAVEGSDDHLARTPLGKQLQELLRDNKERQLQEIMNQLEPKLGPGRVQRTLVDTPSAWYALTTHALEQQPDLVVVPADIESRYPAFGSTSQHLFRKCPSPVWALSPGTREVPKRILVAVDPGAHDGDNRKLSRAVLRFALRLCEPLDARLHLAHAWKVWGEHLSSPRMSRATIAEYVEQERDTATTVLEELMIECSAMGKVAEQHLIKGDPEEMIPALARKLEPDVVIVGSAARTGLAGFFMGSVAETVLNRLQCSAIVVKPPSYVSPVARR